MPRPPVPLTETAHKTGRTWRAACLPNRLQVRQGLQDHVLGMFGKCGHTEAPSSSNLVLRGTVDRPNMKNGVRFL